MKVLSSRNFIVVFILISFVISPSFFSETPAYAKGKEVIFPIDPVDAKRMWWTDTWGAPRSGGRSHQGVDMFGPKMLKVVSPSDAVVLYGRYDNDSTGLSGNYIKLRDAQGWEYLIVHMNNDTPGTDDANASCDQVFSKKLCDTITGTRLAGGTEVSAGEFLGYLGDSGNAETTPSHIHFEVHEPEVSDPSEASPINPTPFVDASYYAVYGFVPPYPNEPNGPWPSDWHVSESIYQTFYGRAPSMDERILIKSSINTKGVWSLYGGMLAIDSQPVSEMVRLYKAYFRRTPDIDGLNYWVSKLRQGESLDDIAEWFGQSAEYRARYGSDSNSEFIDKLYKDVLNRSADESGRKYWIEQLNSGKVTKSSIVVYFSESYEMRAKYAQYTQAVVSWRMFGSRMPSNAEISKWKTNKEANISKKLKIFFG